MPNPKRRHSKARTRSRRAHDFLKQKSTSICPQCHEPLEIPGDYLSLFGVGFLGYTGARTWEKAKGVTK